MTETTEITVYERLKNLCKLKGITIKQMEQEVGVSQNATFKWKTSSPTLKTAKKLAEYFGVSQDYILFGELGKEYEHYTDPETAELIEVIKTSPELKAIFRVTRTMPKERLDAIYNLIKDLK